MAIVTKQEIIDAVDVELYHCYGNLSKEEGRLMMKIEIQYFVHGFLSKALKRLDFTPPEPPPAPPAPDVDLSNLGLFTMKELEKAHIAGTLKKIKERNKAAEVLGITERTLYRKIKEYGLNDGRRKNIQRLTAGAIK